MRPPFDAKQAAAQGLYPGIDYVFDWTAEGGVVVSGTGLRAKVGGRGAKRRRKHPKQSWVHYTSNSSYGDVKPSGYSTVEYIEYVQETILDVPFISNLPKVPEPIPTWTFESSGQIGIAGNYHSNLVCDKTVEFIHEWNDAAIMGLTQTQAEDYAFFGWHEETAICAEFGSEISVQPSMDWRIYREDEQLLFAPPPPNDLAHQEDIKLMSGQLNEELTTLRLRQQAVDEDDLLLL